MSRKMGHPYRVLWECSIAERVDEMGKDISGTGFDTKDKLNIMRIKNTALISEVDVSEAHEEELAKRSDLIPEPRTLNL
jgi:hypothetical protein